MTKEGKILKALSGFYYVNCSGEIVTCRARGNFRNENITPLVGDDVKIQMSDDNTGYVVEILGRKNELLRPKVANIDYSIIVVSVKDPEFSSKLLNKTICLNENSDVDIIIIFTKLDLLKDDELEKMKEIMNYYYEIGYQVFTNSEEDIDKLKEVISNKYVAISGQSGAGKSTFINKLAEHLDIDVDDTRLDIRNFIKLMIFISQIHRDFLHLILHLLKKKIYNTYLESFMTMIVNSNHVITWRKFNVV